ncbi:MAG: tetratricopeptide repeat protein, partial [Bacteroidia bacterium]|nr:tetratricopeptide repeat protein [Bacteroidia bacterium]
MKSVNKIQVAVIAGAFVLVVLLLLLNTKLPQKNEQAAVTTTASVTDVNKFVENIIASLDKTQKQEFVKLEKKLSSSANKQKAFEEIIHFFDSARQPIVAAYYMEQTASAIPTDSNWTYAGARYYSAIQFSKSENHAMLYQKAIQCFEKTIEINPNNTDA